MPSAWAASAKSAGRRCPFSEVREDSRVTTWDSRAAKASVSRNYRFPTLNDLYFLPGGNPGLNSEKGVAYEAGLIDIDKFDTVYGNDSRMIGYKNVRNRCFLIRTGVNF